MPYTPTAFVLQGPMSLLSEAEVLDRELQLIATGATVHRIQNLRALLKMSASLLEQQPTKKNEDRLRALILHVHTYCLKKKCPCHKPCSSYNPEKEPCKR